MSITEEQFTTRVNSIGRDHDGRPEPYKLANLAGVAQPDGITSPGSKFVFGVFDYWVGRVGELTGEVFTESGRDSISRDTSTYPEGLNEFQCWQVFTDLCLFNDDDLVDITGTIGAGSARAMLEHVAHKMAETFNSTLLVIVGKDA